ncbi:MAG: 4Fe-4S binding protein [Elusimicrobia bacterium]|nr:4Fe-4S binding protein [Elusimicrobiota bacterium]
MPWIDEDKCIGCEVCLEKCPVGAILMENDKAKINMDKCIRCGTCHDVCKLEAVRHDGEKIPEQVKINVETTKEFMKACAKYLGNDNEKWKCLERMKKHFNKEKIIAEKTLTQLEMLKKV